MLYALGFVGLFTIGGLTGLVARHARGSTCTCTTRISSSPISTTSWSAARSGLSSAGCIIGGRRSPAGMYPEMWARVRGDPDVRRLQHDVLSAIHPRLSRHAAALLRLSARIPGLERAVVGGRIDPRRRLCAAAVLSRLVAALGRSAGANPWRATGLEWQTSSPPARA